MARRRCSTRFTWCILRILPILTAYSNVSAENPVFTAIECQGMEPLDLICPEKHDLHIYSLFWGREDIKTCPHSRLETNVTCAADDKEIYTARRQCDGYRSCQLVPEIHEFGEPCPDVFKYLKIEYTCIQWLRGGGWFPSV